MVTNYAIHSPEFTDQFGVVAYSYLDLQKFALDANKTEIKSLIDDTLNDVISLPTCYYPDAQLRPQLSISGRYGYGPVDFAIECNKTLILITEAKKQDMDQGFAQCGIQLDAAGHVNREEEA
ncbi:hypothetical protein EV426DRAFT_705579 [Tirmania nivea]|nr:hypothetical protein EV426DRAFT_705579 [Tirmania nivea]